MKNTEIFFQEKILELTEKIRQKSIFVTGATGFFGRSLLDMLLVNQDQQITILSRDPESFLLKWPKYKQYQKLNFIKGNILDFEFKLLQFDSILHFATPVATSLKNENPAVIKEIIVGGTKRVLDFAVKTGAKEVLFASSGAVYGKQPKDLKNIPENYLQNTTPDFSGSTYGEAKYEAEQFGLKHSKENSYAFKIARCFAFTGPHLDLNGNFAIGNFIRDALNNRNIQIAGDGSAIRSYLYSEDLIVWLLTILFRGKPAEAYNVGSDIEISILDLAKRITTLLNPGLKISLGKTSDPILAPERYVPSIDKAKKELGLQVWTDLDQAILKTR